MPIASLERARSIFAKDYSAIALRTDRMFFRLLIGQWIAAVIIALVWSPRTWIAQYWTIHQHVLAAVVLGAIFTLYPLYLIATQSGSKYTRHVIAIAQMLQSALLVHMTGGRIETHFHVFGSLALLAFYRDWAVLLTAAAVVYVDHLALGAWFPLSVYGATSATIWRSFEHGVWVIFEGVFLAMSCRTGISELRMIAQRQAELELTSTDLEHSAGELQSMNQSLESRVEERTQELRGAKDSLADANQVLAQKVRELETLNQIMWGREERILELKREINELLKERQGTSRYEI